MNSVPEALKTRAYVAPFAVFVGFPRVWRNVETAFYTPGRESGPPACSTNAHFVTVTAMDEDYLTVSSWGHPYRLSREEFDAYRREASASLLCTILDVREK